MGGSSGSGMFGAASPLFGRGQAQGLEGAEYTPVEGRTYTPQLPSNQNLNPYSQPSALNQQMMAQRSQMQMSPYMQGLQTLYSMFNAPRPMAPMPEYRVPGLMYRPNMQSAQEGLRRVAPSVAEQRRLQAIEDERAAAEAAAQQPQDTRDYSGG